MFLRTRAITYCGFASANIRQKFILAKLLQKKIEKIIFVPMKLSFGRHFFTIFLLVVLSAGVAKGQLHIANAEHNFGTIAEEGGSVEHTFVARNTSSQPLVLVSTRVSCGCTTTEFSRKPIMPDSTISIKVIFSPMNYPGTFARKVVLVTSEGAAEQQLLVRGYVTPRKKSVEERYPLVLGGGVRIATNAHDFVYVEHGKSVQSSFQIVNTSPRSVSLAIEGGGEHIRFDVPSKVAPSAEVEVKFGYSLPRDCGIYGTIADKAYLIIDGKRSAYPLMVRGVAIDSRDEYADNVEPSIVISKKFIKFGTINSTSATKSQTLYITNEGEEPLIIRALESERGLFTVKIDGSMTIRKGEKRVLTINIDPSKLPFGTMVDRLLVVSNAPQQPVCKVRISAIVEQ